MIQSFSIVFAGYKMPACLRPAMSSSSAWCLCRGLSVSGLSPSLAQSDIITLSPISSPLSIDRTSGMEEPRVLPDWDYS